MCVTCWAKLPSKSTGRRWELQNTEVNLSSCFKWSNLLLFQPLCKQTKEVLTRPLGHVRLLVAVSPNHWGASGFRHLKIPCDPTGHELGIAEGWGPGKAGQMPQTSLQRCAFRKTPVWRQPFSGAMPWRARPAWSETATVPQAAVPAAKVDMVMTGKDFRKI